MNYWDNADIRTWNSRKIVTVDGLEKGSEHVRFTFSDGSVYIMEHRSDCCESVQVEDVCGDVADLQDATVINAREESNADVPDQVALERGKKGHYMESETWTFYIIQTNKGAVTIRWLGESNGYYSETPYFYKDKP